MFVQKLCFWASRVALGSEPDMNSPEREWSSDFGKVERAGAQAINARIGRACSVKGILELSGATQIDGSVEGEIISEGEVTVGESGTVTARITTSRLRVFGKVTGDIICREALEFYPGARVIGDIESPSVMIQDGVVFEGRCTMPERDSSTRDESSDLKSSDLKSDGADNDEKVLAINSDTQEEG